MHRIWLTTLLIFFLHSISALVWAGPCGSNQQHTSLTEISMTAEHEPMTIDCHERAAHQQKLSTTDSTDKNSTHCDGLCLCLQATAFQTALRIDNLALFSLANKQLIIPTDSAYFSITHPPLDRPPILLI